MEDPAIKKLLTEINEGFRSHRDDVEETIKKTVNGKIDILTNSFNDWKITEAEKRILIENKLDDYMKTTEPVVKFFTEISSAKKILFYCLSGITLIGGAWFAIKQIFIK